MSEATIQKLEQELEREKRLLACLKSADIVQTQFKNAIGLEDILTRVQGIEFMNIQEYRNYLDAPPSPCLATNPTVVKLDFGVCQLRLDMCLWKKKCRVELSNATERMWIPFYSDLNDYGYQLMSTILAVKQPFTYTSHLIFLAIIKSFLIHYIRKTKVFDEPEFIRFWAT